MLIELCGFWSFFCILALKSIHLTLIRPTNKYIKIKILLFCPLPSDVACYKTVVLVCAIAFNELCYSYGVCVCVCVCVCVFMHAFCSFFCTHSDTILSALLSLSLSAAVASDVD